MSLNSIVWLYLPEILPEKGVACCVFMYWVSAASSGYAFPLITSYVDLEKIFLILMIVCFIGLVFIIIFV